MQIEHRTPQLSISTKRHIVGGTILAAIVLLTGFAIKYSGAAKSIAYVGFREIHHHSTQWRTRNWLSLEGDNFVIRYQPEDKDMAGLILETSEEAYAPVNRILGYEPRGKGLVLVYPSRIDFGKSFGWGAEQRAMGVYWAGVIRVLSPKDWITDVTGDGVEEVFKSSGPVVHEYAHLVVDHIARGNYPRWLTEGVAQYVEREITGFVFTDSIIKDGESWYEFKEIDKHFDTAEGQFKSYRQSLAVVDYMVVRYGEGSIEGILNTLKTGMPLKSAWKAAFGETLDEFEHGFNNWSGMAVSD